jgi:hypothetical protein
MFYEALGDHQGAGHQERAQNSRVIFANHPDSEKFRELVSVFRYVPNHYY